VDKLVLPCFSSAALALEGAQFSGSLVVAIKLILAGLRIATSPFSKLSRCFNKATELKRNPM
jgi:hypothetical protein